MTRADYDNPLYAAHTVASVLFWERMPDAIAWTPVRAGIVDVINGTAYGYVSKHGTLGLACCLGSGDVERAVESVRGRLGVPHRFANGGEWK